MLANDIRQSFLGFFENNQHQILPSSPLIPHNDPTLMFTNSGMVQFKNFFTGIEKPKFTRVTTSQKSVRAGGKHNDLENVGYTARHHTFFEMLGNFSFGDYFKEEAIYYAWNFLVNEIKLSKEKLYFTIYHTDDEAFNFWTKMGADPKRIIRIATSDNFWSMGDTGPCGPCSEIFYDHGEHLSGGLPGQPDEGGDRYVEIWNLVFMQYEQLASGERINLPKPSIDTGMGLERFAAVMQGVHDNYDIDLFKNLIQNTSDIINTKITNENKASFKVIADHLRSTAFLIADGVMPSNEGRGYVLRRIIRRAMRHANFLGYGKEPLLSKLVPSLIREMGSAYPELNRAFESIVETLKLEEHKFLDTLDRGLKLLNQETIKLSSGQNLPGEIAFKLYDTYGFPLDLTCDIMRRENREVEISGFDQAMEQQKKLARESWQGSGEQATEKLWFELHEKFGATEFLGYSLEQAQANILALVANNQNVAQIDKLEQEFFLITNQTPFYGESGGQMGDIGLAENDHVVIEITDTKKYFGKLIIHQCKLKSGKIKLNEVVNLKFNKEHRDSLRRNHSATHILHKALKEILGNHVSQKGSLVAEDRLRFDFSHHKAISKAEILAIEDKVNQVILNNTPVNTQIMDTEQAIQNGAMALFGEKYDEQVRVVSMGLDEADHYSVELCGGTHVKATGDIGLFKIISESSIASGIRRIEAITGIHALKLSQSQEELIDIIAENLKIPTVQINDKIVQLQEEIKFQQKQIAILQKELLNYKLETLYLLNGFKTIACIVDNFDFKEVRKWIEQTVNNNSDLVVVLNLTGDKLSIIVATSSQQLDAKIIAEQLILKLGGSGCGGTQKMAQGGAPKSNKIYDLQQILAEIIDNIAAVA